MRRISTRHRANVQRRTRARAVLDQLLQLDEGAPRHQRLGDEDHGSTARSIEHPFGQDDGERGLCEAADRTRWIPLTRANLHLSTVERMPPVMENAALGVVGIVSYCSGGTRRGTPGCGG